MNKNTNEKKVAIFDVSSHLHRIYHAKKKNSNNVELVFPFMEMINKELNTMGDISHFIFVFDGSSKQNFRSKIYEGYKANRPPSDPLYVEQKRETFKALKNMGATVLCDPMYEADDVINVLSKKLSELKIKHVVSTKDKDLFCLVNEYTKIFLGNKKGSCGVQDVFADKGVFPYQMTDYLTLVGDTSDNIIGVDGVGEKTAAKILEKLTFDEVMLDPECLREVDGIRGVNKIIEDINHRYDDIWFMRSMVELANDVPITLNLKETRVFNPVQRLRELNRNNSLVDKNTRGYKNG